MVNGLEFHALIISEQTRLSVHVLRSSYFNTSRHMFDSLQRIFLRIALGIDIALKKTIGKLWGTFLMICGRTSSHFLRKRISEPQTVIERATFG